MRSVGGIYAANSTHICGFVKRKCSSDSPSQENLLITMNSPEKSIGYTESELGEPSSDSVPIPAPRIGTRISAAADAIGTRKAAAKRIGVSADSLQRYIREENMPPFDVAARLCAASGMSVEWLVTGVGQAKSPQSKGSDEKLRPESVKAAVQLLREVLDNAHAYLTPAQHGEAAILVASLLETGLSWAEIVPIARQTVRVAAAAEPPQDGRSKPGAGQ